MSTQSSLREQLERRVPVQAVDSVRSGSPARYRLSVARQPFTQTVTATLALARRQLPMLRAKRLIERLMDREASVVIEIPMVEDSATFERDLLEQGIIAERLGPADHVNVRAVREQLRMTQEEFAWRFGLDLAALRNWEQERTRPDTAVRSLLQVIAREPAAVERALVAR